MNRNIIPFYSSLLHVISVIVIAVLTFGPMTAVSAILPDTSEQDQERPLIKEMLHLGPVNYFSPVFHDDPAIDGSKWDATEILLSDLMDYDEWQPREGLPVAWSDGQHPEWTAHTLEDSILVLPGATKEHHNISWSAVYLSNDRFMPASITLKSEGMIRAFLNGEEIAVKNHTDTEDGAEAGSVNANVNLRQGTQLLLVKTMHPAAENSSGSEEELPDWTLEVQVDAGEHQHRIASVIVPERHVMQRDLSNAPRPAGVSVSPDGDLAAVHVRRDLPPDGTPETHIDIRNIPEGTIRHRFAGGMDITGMQWLPEGLRFSYTEAGNDGTNLWVIDLETGEKERILKDVEDFAGYRWSPDASYVIYSVTEKHDPGRDGVIHYRGLQDRRPGYHDRSFLYKLNVEQGSTRRLTAGLLSTTLNSIHPDGKKILFSRNHEVYDERPYGETEYIILDLQTMQTDSLFTVKFAGSGQFSPDGDRILITGGPGTFGDEGVNIPDTLLPNDYDTQAYLYDLESREITSITRDFDPEITGASWDETGRYIYFTVTEKSYRNLYRYDTRRERFRQYDTGPDVAGSLDLAENKAVGVFTGSGASDTPKAWTIDFTDRSPSATVLYDPGAEAYQHVAFGDVREWTFTNKWDEEIDGHVYYPPDFDEDKEYPVIVYYYGGTTPVTRAFAGRYPKELYAAKGYLVYVLQPSGATGFGQEFSARHVNDWGEIAGEEIITGVAAFLDDHAYADRERVGAMGASYGGFMTMYLLTQTDLFAAAVSHAGISNLASYWGEGFWGYQYSGVATANSFPWNRQDIYVNRSPVFQADDIHTPLMLVTGMSDTNVPPGESLQMFTALKLLDRDVAFIAVKDQDHHILDYKKFIRWKEAIISWFDKWLKDEPEWWKENKSDFE